MDLTCSLNECRNPIVGTGVMLSDSGADIDWRSGSFLVYEGMNEDGPTEWVMLHPVCFTNVFEELVRQEGQSTFFIAIAQSGLFKEELRIN